ncbi:hypothetical protein FRB90_001937 [Tulasnella sp. 427]|nr:hypothetical protein FRB90_001937 [Tulasnella sp. 427]
MQSISDEEAAHEAYILLLLSDANLPTGSFVASAGLESYIKHGFFSTSIDPAAISPFSAALPSSDTSDIKELPTPPRLTSATIRFLQDSVQSYGRSALPFVGTVHGILEKGNSDSGARDDFQEILRLDALYESMTLNHVARRASKAQGVALLTLYSKVSSISYRKKLNNYVQGFSEPLWIPKGRSPLSQSMTTLVDRLKVEIRRGKSPGHLPICWAVLAAALGLTEERSQHLHIFLHARALLSASVRLNTVGPYAAQQLLLHVVEPMVQDAVARSRDLKVHFVENPGEQDSDLVGEEDGPANTWPLGEILSGRHDQQHSRIFNS